MDSEKSPDARKAIDQTPPEKPRPYRHLTVDELREVEPLTDAEWFEELRARGILVPAYDGPPQPFAPVNPPVPPGALERFLKERG